MTKTLLLIVLVWTQSPPVGEPAKVTELISQVEAAEVTGQIYSISQADLNAYLAHQLQEEAQPGVEEARVTLHKEAFVLELLVDMDQVEVEGGMFSSLFKAILQGKQQLRLKGTIETGNGAGVYATQEAFLNGVSLPVSLVDSLLESLGSRQTPPFNPTEPFVLPYGIQEIRFLEGEAQLKK